MSELAPTPAHNNNNNDELISWLDEAYLVKILNGFTQNQVREIKSFTKVPATTKGENYASCLCLLTIDYSVHTEPEAALQHISLIVKSRLDNELGSQLEDELNVFHREAQVYTVVMEESLKLLRSIGDETIFGPKAIYVDERIIVLENLKLRGYEISNVRQGFSFEQCSMVLEKLAKFHAVSMVLYKKNPDMFRHYLCGNVSETPTLYHDLYANSIRTTIEYCKTQPELLEYVAKLEAFGEKIIPKIINVYSRNQTDRYHVLNHGDLWVNNMMFNKEAKDVLFVDYQEGFFGSAGIDWNYFIFSSWQKDVFLDRLDELVQVYHKSLSDILHKLSYEQRIPTKEDVMKEIVNKGFHGLATATCLLPILISEYSDLADPVNFLLNTDEAVENRRMIFNNPKFGDSLASFLAFFVKNEIL